MQFSDTVSKTKKREEMKTYGSFCSGGEGPRVENKGDGRVRNRGRGRGQGVSGADPARLCTA